MSRASPLIPTSNVVVFGQTGAGKSSLINLLARKKVAKVSSGPSGRTKSNENFDISESPSSNKAYTFWDTPGLNEGEQGTVPAIQAIDNLCNLVDKIHSVNLIIYCICGSRLTEIVRVNYDLFCGIICKGKVPVVLVVTGLEQEENVDDWWIKNHEAVEKMGLGVKKIAGHACVVTTRGRDNLYGEEYSRSAGKVWELVQKHCSPSPWTVKRDHAKEARKGVAKYLKAYNKRIPKIIKAILRWFQ